MSHSSSGVQSRAAFAVLPSVKPFADTRLQYCGITKRNWAKAEECGSDHRPRKKEK